MENKRNKHKYTVIDLACVFLGMTFGVLVVLLIYLTIFWR